MVRFLQSLRVGVKLIVGFLLVALMVFVVAVVGYVNMGSLNTGLTTLYEDRTLPIEYLGMAGERLYAIRGDVFKYLLIPDERATTLASLNASRADIDQALDRYRATYLVPEEIAGLARFDAAWDDYQVAVDNVIRRVDTGDEQSALESLRDGAATANARKAVDAALDTLVAINVRVAEEEHINGEATFSAATLTLAVVATIAIILAVLSGALITRTITVPLGQVARAAAGIAAGDLRQAVEVRSGDEIGQMAQAFSDMVAYLKGMAAVAAQVAENDLTKTVVPLSEHDILGTAFARMIDHWRGLAGQLTQSATALGAASAQLASAATQAGQATTQITATIQQVARGTTQQTAGVTKTASAMEQMKRAIDGVAHGAQDQASAVGKVAATTERLSGAIRQVAGNAQAVTVESTRASDAARVGADTVSDTISGMEAIQTKVGVSVAKVRDLGERSQQIGAIVETIDDIASQTNLLALNAAIEAARAGEHGKGFAVVADEVRKLAEHASAATKQIGELITGMRHTITDAIRAMDEGAGEVERGAAAANQAGAALAHILSAAQAVQAQAAAALDASQRMGDLSTHMVEATEAVSAVVEENTAATEEMAAGSDEILQAIEGIASVSEENNASVEEVSASAEEMHAQVEEVAASASSLSEMADGLRVLVARFKLPTAGVALPDTAVLVRARHEPEPVR